MDRTELLDAISKLSDSELTAILAERQQRHSTKVGREAVVIENHLSNGGTKEGNLKYISAAYNRKVRLVHALEGVSGWYITDFFQPQFASENNDYVYHGFLVVGEGDIKLLP